MDRAQLEQLAIEKMRQTQDAPLSSIERAQLEKMALEKMALEKMAKSGMTEVNTDREASLGFVNRAQYAIEPIQSNRKAFLEKQYGHDNIMEDKKGDLFVRENGRFLPVNKEGFSVADVADFAGATPEIAGGVVGTVAGAIGGGGVASVPAAIGLGAAGGALGSVIRQGASAALGTPQVANIGERALETGMSGVFGGVGSAAGLGIKAVLPKAKQGIKNIIKSLPNKGDVIETSAKTVGKADLRLVGEVTPEYVEKSADNIMGEVVDQSGRDVVQEETKKLKEIALRQGLPEPTYAQAAQGKALIAETKLMDTPLIGGKARKQVDSALKLIKGNLEKITGEFLNSDSTVFEVGHAAREMMETGLASFKKIASELYDHVEEYGSGAMIGKRTFFNKFRDYAGNMGIINPDLTPAKYSADTGLTREAFDHIQSAVFDGMNAINNNPSGRIQFAAINALRKTLKGTVKELEKKNPTAAMHLKKFARTLDDTIQNALNREHPKLGEVFKEADKNYAQYKRLQSFARKIFKDGVGDEKNVKIIMGHTGNVEGLKEIIGADNVRSIGKSFVRDILKGLSKSGIGKADVALTAIKENAPQIKSALGQATYDALVDNLHYLSRTGQPLGVARASLYNILDNRGPGLSGLSLNIVGSAKTLAESKGTTVFKAGKDAAINASSKAVLTANKSLPGASNLLTDTTQRNMSSFPSYKGGQTSQREKDIEARKRAISGGKNNNLEGK